MTSPLVIGAYYHSNEAGQVVELLAVSGPWAWVKRAGWLPSTVRVSQLRLATTATTALAGAEPKPPDIGHK